MLPLSCERKLALIARAQSGEKVAKLCREAGVCRKTFYSWLKKYKATRPHVAHHALRDRRFKSNLRVSTLHSKDKLLIVSKALYSKSLRSGSPEAKIQDSRPESVAAICRAFKISRKTFYKWFARYQKAGEDGLAEQRLRGKAHPRAISDEKEEALLDYVAANPHFSVHKLNRALDFIGHHGIQNVLARKNLNTYQSRLLFAKDYVRQPSVAISPLYAPEIPVYKWRMLFAPFKTVPKLLVSNPIRALTLLAFSLSPLVIFIFFLRLIFTSPPGTSPIGLVFAAIALVFGLFFFLYSLKYYASVLMVLKLAQSGAKAPASSQLTVHSSRLGKLLSKLGITIPYRERPYQINPLLLNLNEVELEAVKPFVSIHAAIYNEKRVVERLIRSTTAQDWYQTPQNHAEQDAELRGNSRTANGSVGGVANYEVVIADDSTDETTEIVKQQLATGNWQLVKEEKDSDKEVFVYQAPGLPTVKLIHRFTRQGFKGGALQEALVNTNPRAEYVVVFDADFVPYPDTISQFIKTFQVLNANSQSPAVLADAVGLGRELEANEKRMSESQIAAVQGYPEESSSFARSTSLPHDVASTGQANGTTSSKIAAVQGYQWHVLNKSANWITRGVRTEYAGSYVIERSGEEIYQGLKQIAGSVYAIRADILRTFGWGTSITEDFELTLRLYEQGYKVAFTPYIQAPAEAVSTIKRLIRQRMRWAEGASFNVKCMLPRLLTGRWVDVTEIDSNDNFQFSISNFQSNSNLKFNENFKLKNSNLKVSSNGEQVWIPSKLSLSEKLEFIYLAPYYLQAAFFVVGTFAWFVSEVLFNARLPFWTAAFGWSLVFTNLLALPLMNIIGLFLEESDERDYIGILSFIALSYIVVPFQAYAAIKGFLESSEGPWFRTPKTGIVTDTLGRSSFSKMFGNLLGRPVQAPIMPTRLPDGQVNADLAESANLSSSSNRGSGKVDSRFRGNDNGEGGNEDNGRVFPRPTWAFASNLNFNVNLGVRPKKLRFIGRVSLVVMVISALSLNLVSFNQNFGGLNDKSNKHQSLVINAKNDFAASERPEFNLKIPGPDSESHKTSWFDRIFSAHEAQAAEPNVKASLFDTKGQMVEGATFVTAKVDSGFKVTLANPEILKPGKYTLKTSVGDESGNLSGEAKQDFIWGVLAINTNKSIYTPGEVARLNFGVLDDAGNTICNAKLTLEIKDPGNNSIILSDDNGGIEQSGECSGNNYASTPDYSAAFKTNSVGIYILNLSAQTENGERKIVDRFEVRESVPFDVERTSLPTRIKHSYTYPVKLTIVVNEDFRGEVVESVPDSFEILNPKSEIRNNFKIQNSNDKNEQQIIWEVDWERGNTYQLEYNITFPPVSPEFYLLGPLKFSDNEGQFLFEEARRWQIASDSPGTLWLESGSDATQGLEWWNPIGNAPVTDTAQKNTGPRSIKANAGVTNLTSLVRKAGILADAGRRICAYVNFTNLPTIVTPDKARIIGARKFSLADVIAIRITSGGVLQLDSNGTQIGSNGSTLSTGTWYHLCLTYTITSTTVFDLRVFKDGNTDISVTNSGTLAGTGTDTVEIGWMESPGALNVMNFDDIYIDDSTANTYPGDIRVTAKLPSTTNANNFDTTVGTGAVNERPISATNGKQDATTSTPGATQNYTLETASGGDVNMSGNTIVTRFAWVWAKKGNGSTTTAATIFDNGGETTITLTTSSSLLDVITDSSSYPSNAAGIGMRAIDGGADSFLYEAGTLIGFTGAPVPEFALALAPLSLLAPKIINAIQKGTLIEESKLFLTKIIRALQKTIKKLVGFVTKSIHTKRGIRKRRKRKCG